MAEREGDNIIVTIRRSKLFGKLPQEEEQPCLGPSDPRNLSYSGIKFQWIIKLTR